MALQSLEVMTRLRSGCRKDLTDEMMRTLAGRWSAGSTKESAARLFISERAFRDRLGLVEDIVLGAIGLRRDAWYMCAWMSFHAECCARPAWELIEKSAVFPAEMTSTA